MLTSISPIDGRYYRQVRDLSAYYSEFALIRYRVRVEIEYFIALCELPLPQLKDFDRSLFDTLRGIYRDMTEDEAAEVKEIEKTTNHDVKAVEYFIKRHFDAMGINPRYKEFVHFGLTSQDINNTAVPLSLMEGIQDVYLPQLYEVLNTLDGMAAGRHGRGVEGHPHAGPYPRTARLPHPPGQGDSRIHGQTAGAAEDAPGRAFLGQVRRRHR